MSADTGGSGAGRLALHAPGPGGDHAALHAQRDGDVVRMPAQAAFAPGQQLVHDGAAKAVLAGELAHADAVVVEPLARLFRGSEGVHNGVTWGYRSGGSHGR